MRALSIALLLWAAFFSSHVFAQAWPQKTVRVLVGLAPGGNPDVFARLMAAKLSEALGQQFVVENRPGAGTNIAGDIVAKAPADGHTILVSDSGIAAINPHLYRKMTFDPFRDLAPVSMAVVAPMWLVVHPSIPAASIQELVTLGKAQQAPLPYASSGNGSIHHITMEAFKAQTGTQFTHVPFKGAGQSVPALLAGDVALGFVGYPAMAAAIRAGRLRVLAFSMARRSSVTPDVPTVSETVAPGFDMAASIGVFATGGTSREIVTRLSQALNTALRSPDVLERMAPIGMEPVGTTPDEYASRLRRDYERYGELVKQIGMRID